MFLKISARIFNPKIISALILPVFAFTTCGCLITGCGSSSAPATLEDIVRSGEITVITRNTPHCYYLYSGHPVGFEYDLSKAFADYLGVKLNVKIVKTDKELVRALKRRKGAFIASGLPLPENLRSVRFSDAYMDIRPHIVIHRNNEDVHWIEDLTGKTVHVIKGSSEQTRLEKHREQGLNISIIAHAELPAEELFRRVADGEIEVMVANDNSAYLNRLYYPDIFIAGPVASKQDLSWAVNADAKKLLKTMNSFFKVIKKNGTYADIYQRYYPETVTNKNKDIKDYHEKIRTRLPKYMGIIQHAANKYDIDWVLIAAQMYQESGLDPRARSRPCAYGLMQLILPAAKKLGVINILDPEENINAGVKQLKNLNEFFNKPNSRDKLFIALAAYNVGKGHVLDAQDLARKKGLDPDQWSSLAKTLPLLSREAYYSQSRYGYCRGTEPENYIKQIVIYYDILKRRLKGYSASRSGPAGDAA